MIAAEKSARGAHFTGQGGRVVRLQGDLPGTFRNLTFLGSFVFAFAAGAMVFRLAVQLTAAPRSGFTGALYAIAGVFTEPFLRFETVGSLPSRPVLEFSTLVALEAYLLGGLVVALLLIGLTHLSRRFFPLAWSFDYDLEPAIDTWRALDGSIAAISAEADRAGNRLLTTIAARPKASARSRPLDRRLARELLQPYAEGRRPSGSPPPRRRLTPRRF